MWSRALDRDLADDHDGVACVALFDDLEQVAAALGGEALQPPVVEDQQLDLGEAAHQTVVASGIAGAGELGDQLGDAAVEHGALLAAGLVGERAGEEGLSRPGLSFDDQIEGLADPVAGGELGQGRTGDAASGTAVDIVDVGTHAQLGLAQTREERGADEGAANALMLRAAVRW